MRRKILVVTASALAVALTASAVALAATQVNTYTVTGAIKGAKGATKSKPKPASINFDYTVGEENGLRPSPVTKYSIEFGGMQVNTAPFPGCDVDKLNDPSGAGAKVCPSGSNVGGGQVINQVGPSEDNTNKSLYCYLTLTTFNSTKKNHLLLYLVGSPSASTDPKKQCVTDVHQAIDATFKATKTGTSLNFTVPPNLLHPGGVGVLDNAVVNTTSTIKKLSKKVKGKTVGYFQSVGCTSKTAIKVVFTQESDGASKTATKTGVCK